MTVAQIVEAERVGPDVILSLLCDGKRWKARILDAPPYFENAVRASDGSAGVSIQSDGDSVFVAGILWAVSERRGEWRLVRR